METTTFVERYTAIWNESDPEVRRKTVAALWVEDGVQFTDNHEHRGHDALEARVTEAYEQFVHTGGFVFALASEVANHHNAITFTTKMIPAAGGESAWTGQIFILLAEDGRIQQDYQFGSAITTR
jgi:hypothetical protein